MKCLPRSLNAELICRCYFNETWNGENCGKFFFSNSTLTVFFVLGFIQFLFSKSKIRKFMARAVQEQMNATSISASAASAIFANVHRLTIFGQITMAVVRINKKKLNE